MKKLLMIFLALALMLTPLCMANAETAPRYKLAVGLPDSGSSMFAIMSNNIRKLVELTGGEVYFQGGVGASADAAVAFVESQIAAGVDALFFGPASDDILPTITMMCEEAGVYWGITFRTIQNDEIREMVEASEYYVGRCYEDEESTGYGIMAQLGQEGIKKVAVILMDKGNSASDQREAGVYRAAEEYGMEVVAEARGLTQASDVTAAAESFLAANEDLDCIYVVSTTAAGAQEAVVKAIQDAGRVGQVYSATIDFPDNMDQFMEAGVLKSASGLAHWGYDPFMVAVMMINKCLGCPISDETMTVVMPMYNITDAETAAKWIARFGDETTMYYTDEEMLNLIKENNPDLDEASFNEAIAEFTSSVTEY